MERVFELRTEPHYAVIGDARIALKPEALGSEFVDAYQKVHEVQQQFTGKGKDAADPKSVQKLTNAMTTFVGTFVLDESQEEFGSLRLPTRVLASLVEFCAELYGGGSKNPPAAGGTSSG